jgi:hypothetical protein
MRPRFSTFYAIGLSFLVASITARGTPYWVAWEGEDFPENQGWQRFHGPQGAEAIRTLADGAMSIDGIQSPPVYDFARIYGNGNFDPDAEEVFVMRWRMRVDQIAGPYAWDPGVAIVSDELRIVSLLYSYDRIRSAFEGTTVAFAPGLYHTYELRSADMFTYVLTIDSVQTMEGIFVQTVGTPFVVWGDGSSGSSSRTTWDFFHFGVSPEPGTGALSVIMGMVGLCWLRRRRFV